MGLLQRNGPPTVLEDLGRDYLEVDGRLGALDDDVDIVTPGAGRQILPSVVGHDRHDGGHVVVGNRVGALHRAGHDGARRESHEESDVGEASGPLDRLPRSNDDAAIEQLGTVVVDKYRWDVTVVEV